LESHYRHRHFCPGCDLDVTISFNVTGMKLDTPIASLFMVGPAYVKRLQKLEITTVGDLIAHFPFRYNDFSLISKIGRIQPGEIVTIEGEVISMKNQYTKHGKKVQRATIKDENGEMEITWFNQPFLAKAIKRGEKYNFSGKISWFGRKVVMISPEYEKIRSPTPGWGGDTIHTGRLVPVYPETWGVSSKWLRSRIAPLLTQIENQLEEYLPKKIISKEKLMAYQKAIFEVHFPQNNQTVQTARKRLAFDELFLIQLAGFYRKKQWQKNQVTHQFKIDQKKNQTFLKQLPFELTNAQKKCVLEIEKDLSSNKPMNRLLQGDVGSGKTVVAAIAIYTAFLNGWQTIILAPTEILAFQHYQTIKAMLEPLGLKIALQTGSVKHLKQLKQPEQFDVAIGTHALFSKKIAFDKLGLVIIDEQHRFGVEQRAEIIKKGKAPHVLSMTATPIPRTISLTLFGDLDLSVIDEMPKGRIKVKTWVVPQAKRQAAYGWIRKEINQEKSQTFIICPLIEESEKETMKDIRAATTEYEKLKKVFPKLKLGLLHGRIKAKEKKEILEKFQKGKIHILIATPVVEVGIDIPNATIMIIEAANRFGLAQLHQLRGRVGRGSKQSYCFLFSLFRGKSAWSRLKAMETTFVGMELAELDLKMRGPGEIYGVKQHGLPDLKIASFTDFDLVKKARTAAESTIDDLKKFPLLQEKLKKHIIRQIEPN